MANDQKNEWSARLKAFGMIIKLSNDLFAAPDFTTASGIAVNSSCTLLRYKSSTMLEIQGGKARVVTPFAQVAVNQSTNEAQAQCALCEHLELTEKPQVLTLADCSNLDQRAGVALSQLIGDRETMMVVMLAPPPFLGKVDFRLVWLLEFPEEVPNFAMNAASILVRNYAEALYCHRCCRASGKVRLRSIFRPRKVALYILLAVIAALMFVPVNESVNAEFVVKAPETVSSYAWFDGPIAKCYKQDGDRVKAGQVIAEYDTSQVAFRLANAASQVREIEKEYDLESSAAFSDRTRLGKVQLIEARLNGAKVAVDEANWYLAHSKFIAPVDGVLALADGRAELLTNRAVRTGDKIFDIYTGDGNVAEILVNERDSSILQGKLDATLFLYTRPDQAIEAEVTSISNYPELTEQRVYCYKVRAAMNNADNLRFGMRGIAKLRGERVSLGYYLFRNLVIYLRWI